MIINGLKWLATFGGWGENVAQVEFFDEDGSRRYILASTGTEDWQITISGENIIEDLYEEESESEKAVLQQFGAELPDLIPRIILSGGLDICFVMQALQAFPGFDEEDQWESTAEAYIQQYIGKDTKELYEQNTVGMNC